MLICHIFCTQSFGPGPHTEQQKEEMKNLQVILSKAQQENLKVCYYVTFFVAWTKIELWPIGNVNVQRCFLVIFQYKPFSLQYSWLSVEQPIRFLTECWIIIISWDSLRNLQGIVTRILKKENLDLTVVLLKALLMKYKNFLLHCYIHQLSKFSSMLVRHTEEIGWAN